MYFWDMRYFVIMLPVLVLTMWAQWHVRSAFEKYSKVRTMQGLTGAQVARTILDSQGLTGVPVEELPNAGPLDNHYDPRDRTLHLSPQVARSNSVAAVGVAAHECGHAVQHAQSYVPLQARTAIVPAAAFGSNIGGLLVMAGVMLFIFTHVGFAFWLVWAGIAFFAIATVFSMLTLPVELNASKRAMSLLQSTGLIDRTEYGQARSVLNAAAWTYVAGLAAAVANLFYYIMLASGMGRRR